MKFVKNTKYYRGIVYEWNLPTGWSCPFAKECLVKVDKDTGKFTNKSKAYKCYAANAERFPAVRKHRWDNYEFVKNGGKIVVPKEAQAVRIHASGDFFNQQYFDMWLEVCRENPAVEFWAYTKSLTYWINKINDIPNNLVLTASSDGTNDDVIRKYAMKYALVFDFPNEVPLGMKIDENDDCARDKSIKRFALLNNFKTKKKSLAILV